MRSKEIIFDGRAIKWGYSGLGRFTLNILIELIQSNYYSKLVIITNGDWRSNDLKKVTRLCRDNNEIEFYHTSIQPYSLSHHLILPIKLSAKYNNYSYLYPHFDLPLLNLKRETLVIVHDLFPLKVDNYFIKRKKLKILAFKLLIKTLLWKKNVELITVSKTTKLDLIQLFKTKKYINVCYEGVTLNSQSSLHNTDLNEKYIFYVGDRRPHKNLKYLLDLFQCLKTKYHYSGKLLLIGNNKNYDFNLEEYIDAKKMKDVLIQDTINDDQLISIYQNADSLIFISLYEGFGLPILEAVKYKTRIITSSNGALGEIAPPGSLKIEPKQASLEKNALMISNYLNQEKQSYPPEYLEYFSWKQTIDRIFKM